MAEPVDVVVVGAGPAGTAAAMSARARGLSVVCIDKARFPRDKTCGDGLTASALRLLEKLGVSAADLGEWHAARQYFEHVADERLWVLFERDLLPGYVWVFPLPGGRANVGYGVLRSDGRSGRQLKDLWPALLARPVVRDILGPDA